MNTQAHALLNYVVLRKKARPELGVPIFVGAILPDLSMFWFYFYEKILKGQPENLIWSEHYYHPTWQATIDVFNSIPIVAVVCLFAWKLGHPRTLVLGLSMLLHILFDFPLHHEDAHRHFFPLSDFRFESPVSYWDPKHFGHIAAPIEMACYLLGSLWVWRSLRSRWAQVGIVVGAVAYVGVFFYFVVLN